MGAAYELELDWEAWTARGRDTITVPEEEKT